MMLISTFSVDSPLCQRPRRRDDPCLHVIQGGKLPKSTEQISVQNTTMFQKKIFCNVFAPLQVSAEETIGENEPSKRYTISFVPVDVGDHSIEVNIFLLK